MIITIHISAISQTGQPPPYPYPNIITTISLRPGRAVPSSEAARGGSQVPAGATVSRAQHRITFSGASVRYLCPVPGHAQKGMTGTFTVSA